MDSDGRCTVVACRDGSLRLLGSLKDGGFTQASLWFRCMVRVCDGTRIISNFYVCVRVG